MTLHQIDGELSKEAGKRIAKRELTRLGFQVAEVPVAENSNRADLLVTDADSEYLIEVKDKTDAESLPSELAAAFARGELHHASDSLAYDNSVSSVLRYARKQLDATPKNPGTFQLIWLHATGLNAGVNYHQAIATFYGHEWIRAPQWEPRPEPKLGCFYFYYSCAYDMPTIEALIVTDKHDLQVCLNEFSHRADEFRKTSLYRKFAERGGILDPVALASDEQIVALKSDVPRRNQAAVLKALQQQTGVNFSVTHIDRHSFTAGEAP